MRVLRTLRAAEVSYKARDNQQANVCVGTDKGLWGLGYLPSSALFFLLLCR
jgi:hypothetical protein